MADTTQEWLRGLEEKYGVASSEPVSPAVAEPRPEPRPTPWGRPETKSLTQAVTEPTQAAPVTVAQPAPAGEVQFPTPAPIAQPAPLSPTPTPTAPPATPVPDQTQVYLKGLEEKYGIGAPKPAPVAPEAATTAAPLPAIAPAPKPEAPKPALTPAEQIPTFREPLPQAIAPAPAVAEEPLAFRAFKELGRFAATANKHVLETVQGFMRGLENVMAVPYRAATGDWESKTPHNLTWLTGKALEVGAPEKMIKEAHPVTKFLGNLLGGLESYMLPGKTMGAAGVVLPNANLMQKFGSNLLTFGSTDVFQTVGAGGSDEQVRDALIKSIPTAALFTVAQSIPFNKLTQNPWLTKALESTATGTAFAGSHALGGETDPTALAVSFLTGFALHVVTSGVPRPQKGFTPEQMAQFWDDHFKDYTIDWKKTNGVDEEQWGAVKQILDAIKQEPIQEVAPGKPILDQFGRPAAVDETQAALAKQPFERNAQEKLLADRAAQDARERVTPTVTPAPTEIILGTAARERANVGELPVDRLQRAVDVVGDTEAGKQLGDLLAGNQEDLANAFRAPGDTRGIPEITDRIMDLAQKVEDTGDPGAAKELNDFINSNLGALKGLPRWPAAGGTEPVVEPPRTPESPMGVAGSEKTPTPTPTPPKIAPPAASGEVAPEVKAPTTPAPPMDNSGTAAQTLGVKKSPEAPFKMPTAEQLGKMSDADLETLAKQAKAAGIDVEMLGTGAYSVNEPGQGDPFLERLKALRQQALDKVPGAVVAPAGALSAPGLKAPVEPIAPVTPEEQGVPGLMTRSEFAAATKIKRYGDKGLKLEYPDGTSDYKKQSKRVVAPWDEMERWAIDKAYEDYSNKVQGENALKDAEERAKTEPGFVNRQAAAIPGTPAFTDYITQKAAPAAMPTLPPEPWKMARNDYIQAGIESAKGLSGKEKAAFTRSLGQEHERSVEEQMQLQNPELGFDQIGDYPKLAEKYFQEPGGEPPAPVNVHEMDFDSFKEALIRGQLTENPDVVVAPASPEYTAALNGYSDAIEFLDRTHGNLAKLRPTGGATLSQLLKIASDIDERHVGPGRDKLEINGFDLTTELLNLKHAVETLDKIKPKEIDRWAQATYDLTMKNVPESASKPAEVVQPTPLPPFEDIPVQTRDDKITSHERIVGQTKINAVTYSRFQDMVKTQNWPEVQKELYLSSANFTRGAFDHHFNPLNLMARLVEDGMPRAEAKAVVKDYEAQAFKPVQEALSKPAAPEPKVLSPEMAAVAAFNQKYGGAARVGIPEAPQGVDLTGLAPGIDPVATGFLPATKSPTSLPTYKNFPTEKLELVPDIFQHKREADPLTGGGLSLTDIEKYDQTAAGNISVFETKDGRFLVSNGHQRTNAAKRLNEPTVGIQVRREVDGWTQQEVRVASALENLKGGTVDALDIGSYLRETGLTADNLAAKGVSLTKAEVQKGIGLSGLPDRVWQDVYRGVWGHHGDAQAVEKGAALGALRENPAAQEAIYKRLMELQSEGKDLSLPAIRNLVDAGRVAIVTEGQQKGLFGDEDVVNSRIFERAALVTYIQKELTTDKNAHLAANRERDRLEAAGNVIDAKANKVIAERAKEVLGVFGRSSKVGWTETSRVLNEFAERFAQAKDIGEENAIKREALTEIHSALEADYQAIGRADLGKTTGRGPTGKESGQPGGERSPGAPLGVREPEPGLSTKRYVQVTVKDEASGKTYKVFLKNVVDKGRFLTGIEVDKTGEEVAPKGKGVPDGNRLHFIEKAAIKSQAEYRMNLKYGELDKTEEPPTEKESGYERPLSKFEKRLKGITDTYPDADPDRVAQALRAMPKSSDRELAGLAAMKPAEAAGVVKGTLTGLERQEAARRAGVPGATLFPEMGGGGGLFDQAPEAPRVPAGARPVETPRAATPEAGEWGMVAHPGGEAEAKEMAQRMGGQDPKNEYRARVDEIGQWIVEKKVVVASNQRQAEITKLEKELAAGKPEGNQDAWDYDKNIIEQRVEGLKKATHTAIDRFGEVVPALPPERGDPKVGDETRFGTLIEAYREPDGELRVSTEFLNLRKSQADQILADIKGGGLEGNLFPEMGRVAPVAPQRSPQATAPAERPIVRAGDKVINKETGETGTVRGEPRAWNGPDGENQYLEVKWNGKAGVSKARIDYNVRGDEVDLPAARPGATLKEAVPAQNAANLRKALEREGLSFLLDMSKADALAEIAKTRDYWQEIRTGKAGPKATLDAERWLNRLDIAEKTINRSIRDAVAAKDEFAYLKAPEITGKVGDRILKQDTLFEPQAPYALDAAEAALNVKEPEATPEERQGQLIRGEPVPSFKEFEAELAKDDYARERELRDPANKLIPLYEGERYLGTRGGDFIKDAKGKTIKLDNKDIYERLYAPEKGRGQLPIGTETAKPEDLLGTPEKPGPEGTVEKPPGYVAGIVRSVREKFSAANISEKAGLAHQFIVEHLGWAAREVKKDAAVLDKYSERFGAMTQADLLKFTDAAEQGRLNEVAPDLQEAAGAWRRISDGLHSLLVDAKGGESAYWENYFPRLFKDPEKAASAIAQLLKSRGTSLTGPESMNKARTQLLFSDSIRPVEEGGLGLEPRYPNYVDMMKGNIYETVRFLTGKYIESDLKDAGFITKTKTSGWEDLGRLGDKTLDGYYAHPDVARVMENFLSKGLRGDPLFEIYNSPASFMNTVMVGMSAFHATFSTFSDLAHGIGSNLSRAIGAAVTGRFGLSGHYLAEMAKAGNIPANVMRGGKLGEEYTKPGSHPEMAAIVDLMTKAGIRFESPGFKETLKAIFKPGGTSQTELGQMSKTFAEVAAQQIGIPRKVMETIAWPIMSYLVPRLKINATARLLQMELDTLARDGKMKDMKPEDITRLAQEVARKSDNIFGQMVYDNLSMSRGLRDGMRTLVGFPGWNIGSFTDILQASKGIGQVGYQSGKAVWDIAHGQKPTWENLSRSNRMSMEFYMGTVMVMAVFGAITQRLLTGEWPGNAKDLFMPQTGELMANGQPERLRAPTYMRDVLSLNHPFEMAKHKLNWPLRMMANLVSNQDFFGTQIRDPYAGAGEQAGQVGKFVGKSLLPFGIQGYMATEAPKARALNLIGITKVPRLYSNSDAMNVIDEYNTQNRATMTSHEAEAEKNLKVDLRKLAKAQDEEGFKEAAQAAMEEGKLTRQQVKTIVAESQAPPGLGRFVALPVEWQVRAMAKATDQEKELWQPYFIKKVMSAKPEILIRNRDILDPTLREMGLDDAADAIQNLKISDKAGTFKLAGLGVRQPTGEMGDIDTVDIAMAKQIAAQEAKLGTEKIKKSKKTSKYSFLGIQ